MRALWQTAPEHGETGWPRNSNSGGQAAAAIPIHGQPAEGCAGPAGDCPGQVSKQLWEQVVKSLSKEASALVIGGPNRGANPAIEVQKMKAEDDPKAFLNLSLYSIYLYIHIPSFKP